MSRLLGPFSVTTSSVSERASALAADQIAGAGTMAPAATPVTDLRKSRRFMADFQRPVMTLDGTSQGSCQNLMESYILPKWLSYMDVADNVRPQTAGLGAAIAYSA